MTHVFGTTPAVVAAARANLSDAAWDKVIGGTESETTLRRNRMGFDSLAFHPRAQSCDASVDPSTTVLGQPLRIPVMTSPIGSLHVFTPDGSRSAVRATGEFGTVPFVSSNSRVGFEDVAASVAGPKVLQLAFRGDLDWCADVLERARHAGYVAVCVTVDTARLGRQERQIVNNRRAQTAEHPFRTGLTWADLDEIRHIAGLPIVLKGIASREDARLAVDHGVDAICVSNHGGHSVDHGRAAIDALPEVVEEVDGRAEVLMDSGVMRGTDVVKALALGARAAMIGKLQALGLAAAGESGLRAVLEILEDEIASCLELLGAPSVADLGPERLRDAKPVAFPSDTSAFPRSPNLSARP